MGPSETKFHLVKTDTIYDGIVFIIKGGKLQVIGENSKDELLLLIDKIIFKLLKSPTEYFCVWFKLEI